MILQEAMKGSGQVPPSSRIRNVNVGHVNGSLGCNVRRGLQTGVELDGDTRGDARWFVHEVKARRPL